jgi:hypothetical protein
MNIHINIHAHANTNVPTVSNWAIMGRVESMYVLNRFLMDSILSSTRPLVSARLSNLFSMTSSLVSKNNTKASSAYLQVVCVCVCMYVCVYVYLYVRMCVYMYACMYVCTHIRTYVCTYVCTYPFMIVFHPCRLSWLRGKPSIKKFIRPHDTCFSIASLIRLTVISTGTILPSCSVCRCVYRCVCMYVCTYVCMHIYMYVCVYILVGS